jgi:hypothetical protein
MIPKFIPTNREQQYLFPPSIKDWLPETHLAKFIVDIVSQLDLRPIADTYAGKGFKAYHPEILLSLLFYGYATGVFSSVPDKDEFDYAFDVEVETLTLFGAINVFKEAGVEDMDNVFKFYIAADLLNHTDCHLGNIGFIRDLKTGLTKFSPVYDVGNFGAYGDARTILSTSSETYDLDGEALQKLGRKCGVLDWQSIVSTMIKKIRRALPESLQAAQALPWLRDIEIPETKNLRGPSDLDEFFDVYSGSVSRSLDCLESNLQISDQNSKFGSFSAEFAGAIVLDRLSNDEIQIL